MMKLILSLTLIWTLSSTAEALQCWHGKGIDIRENVLRPCKSSELCVTAAYQENMHGHVTQSNNRKCFPSSLFSEGKHTFSHSIGTVTVTTSVHLCNTDGCNNEYIPYPGVQKKNGRQCFTCDDPHSTVCTQTVQCVGVEDRCFNMTVENEHHEMPTSYSLGCISANFCEDTRRLLFFLLGNSEHRQKFNVVCGGNSAWSVRLNVMSLLLGLFTLTFY
ncbi:uncharacterized protein LOC128361983 [Scomber scombrus]|uniref:Uncharacterized protein LOC128361983 n=1 Tax=Scomber scombrus TaxID=13677 RepID=A0AAV1NYR3_SCOSC